MQAGSDDRNAKERTPARRRKGGTKCLCTRINHKLERRLHTRVQSLVRHVLVPCTACCVAHERLRACLCVCRCPLWCPFLCKGRCADTPVRSRLRLDSGSSEDSMIDVPKRPGATSLETLNSPKCPNNCQTLSIHRQSCAASRRVSSRTQHTPLFNP